MVSIATRVRREHSLSLFSIAKHRRVSQRFCQSQRSFLAARVCSSYESDPSGSTNGTPATKIDVGMIPGQPMKLRLTRGVTNMPYAVASSKNASNTARHRRRVANSLFSHLATYPHSLHLRPGDPPISYQHFGHRLRPRDRSQSNDQPSIPNPAPASTRPADKKTQSLHGCISLL